MREFTFSDEQLAQIRHDRARHPHPRVQQKMNVLWLKSRGLTHDRIADLADTSLRTVQRVLTEYLEGGPSTRPTGMASTRSWTTTLPRWKTTSSSTRPAPPAKPRPRSSA